MAGTGLRLGAPSPQQSPPARSEPAGLGWVGVGKAARGKGEAVWVRQSARAGESWGEPHSELVATQTSIT